MPELNEELPTQEASGSVGGISPDIEALSAAGRGMEAFGQTATEGGTFLLRRSAQQEVSNVYADMATARENYTEQLQNALQTGQLDTEQFASQMKDETDKIGENLSTPEGRNFFERQQARLQGSMLLKASHISGQIAANQTVDSLTQAGNSLSNTAMIDPNQYGDILEQNEEMIDAAVNTGQLPQQKADQLRKELNSKIVDGAAKGLAQMDPGIYTDGPNKGLPKQNYLLQALDKMKEQPEDEQSFFKYLDADRIGQLEQYAREQDTIRRAGKEQSIRDQNLAEEQRTKAILAKAVPGIFDGSFHANQIPGLNLPFKESMELAGAIHRMSTETTFNNPTAVNQLVRQIGAGQITDESQILPRLGVDVDVQNYKMLRGLLLQTPGGEADKTNRKMMLDAARASLVKGDPMMGEKDPQGEQNLLRFTQDLQNEEMKLHLQKQPVSSLYQYKSKDYFLNQLPKYQRTPEQILQDMAGGNTQEMVRVKRKSDGTIGTIPRNNFDASKYEETK